MPYIETLQDIVEELADTFGVYGGYRDDPDNHETCKPTFTKAGDSCRLCWTEWLRGRIRTGLHNERSIGRETNGEAD